MDIPRSLQDFLGSGAGDSAPCTIIDGPVRTRSGGTVLQREDDDGGPADEAVNQEDGAPLLRVGAVVDAAAVAFGETYVVVAGRVRGLRRADPRQRGALARRLEPWTPSTTRSLNSSLTPPSHPSVEARTSAARAGPA